MKNAKKINRDYQIPVKLDEVEREKLVRIALEWGVSLVSAIRRLIRETPTKDKS